MARRSTLQLLNEASEAMEGLGIPGQRGGAAKTAQMPTSGNFQPGELMTQRAAHRLVDMTVEEGAILREYTNVRRSQRSGSIPKMDFNRRVSQKAAPEGQPNTYARAPNQDEVKYDCVKVHATQFIPLEAIREARATGEPDFEAKLRRGFLRAFGNDVALLTMMGDKDTDPSLGDDERLLCSVDGVLKQARNGRAKHYTTPRGHAWESSVLFHMKRRLARRYRSSKNNRFMMESMVNVAWREERANVGDSGGTPAAADRALTQEGNIPMLGERSLNVPQIPVDQGLATCSALPEPADAISTASGRITFRVDTLAGGAAALHEGRMVRVTHRTTGESEEAHVQWDGTNNTITTVGTLGQTTVSTNPVDYVLDFADLTTMLYGDPKNIFVVWCDKIRAYSKVEGEAERLRMDVFLELDVGIFEPDALVVQDGIALKEPNNPWNGSL